MASQDDHAEDTTMPPVPVPAHGDLVRCGGCGAAFVVSAPSPRIVCEHCAGDALVVLRGR